MIINKNIFWNFYRVTKQDREHLHKHRAMLLWFTGLSGSGKSVLANLLEEELYCRLINTYVLDGDNIRHGLCRDLNFSTYDRHENIRRIGEVAKLMVDAGLVVLATFVSPVQSDRQMIRNMFPVNCFIEIFVDTPLYICEERDTKGLYKKSRADVIKNFTGISACYEKPEDPEIYLDGKKPISELMRDLLDFIVTKIFNKI